jgi:hypothetical protein
MRGLNAVGCAAVGGGGCASLICLAGTILVWMVELTGSGDGLRVSGLGALPAYLRPLYQSPRIIMTASLLASVSVLLTAARDKVTSARLPLAANLRGGVLLMNYGSITVRLFWL